MDNSYKLVSNETLNEQILHYSEWRSRLSELVQSIRQFLTEKQITDLHSRHQFDNVLGALADDSLSVAFVAEYSRGKSELINTLFFGNFKRRVLPSGSGRTTMCPTELKYDPNLPVGVRLLPIESRKSDLPLYELKKRSKSWTQTTFDKDDIDSMVKIFERMSDSKLVSKEYAKELKFDLIEDEHTKVGLPVNEYDEVEIPSWRHGIINLPHPLLEQGLVILDTPGLNAIGAEPELTINQLSTAHTILFVLSQDTGVTSTDLALWEQHISNAGLQGNQQNNVGKGNLVVLNKIDELWDGIRTSVQIEKEIDMQVANTAQHLNIPRDNIFPVSAQKSLLAKISSDEKLLQRSGIKHLENAIADRLIPQKRMIVMEKVRSSLDSVIESANAIINSRLCDADEHIAELRQLSSKNSDVIAHIMLKVQTDKSDLENEMQRYHAMRSVYSKESTKLLQLLSSERLERLIAVTKHEISRCTTTSTLQKTVDKFFERLNAFIDSAISQANTNVALSQGIIREFKDDRGITNFTTQPLRLEKFKQDVARLESKYNRLKETKVLFFKEQKTITDRFYGSVCTAARKIFSHALKNTNNWNNTLMMPMETYVREHHTQLRRRLESVKRIHRASDTVEVRLNELQLIQENLHKQHQQFYTLNKQLNELFAEAEKTSNQEDDSAEILYLDKSANL